MIGGEPHPQPELRVVFEERVGPSRTAPLDIDGPRRRGQVAAVDRRAARGIGHHHAVAEELREHLQVRCLAAARARAGELEQRFEQLGPAHRGEIHLAALGDRQRFEEGGPSAGRREVRVLPSHVDGAPSADGGVLHGAHLHAEPAAGAVFLVHMQRVARVGEPPRVDRRRWKPVGCAIEPSGSVNFGADHAVRTHERAVPALDADICVPARHRRRDAALLPTRCRAREGAVHGKRAHRQVVAASLEHRRDHVPDERRGSCRHDGQEPPAARRPPRHRHFAEGGERAVHRVEVPRDDLGAFGTVRLLDRCLDPVDGLLARQHAGHREEAGLQHAVGVRAERGLTRDAIRVDRPDVQALVDDLVLRGTWQPIPYLMRAVRAVDEQRRAGCGHAQHIELLDELELMAANELRRPDEVRGMNRLRPKPQVRDGPRPGFLRVVHEVRLHVDVRVLADDLDGVLVGAHRAVGAQPEEHRPEHIARFRGERWVHRQTRLRHIVGDAHGKVILRSGCGQLVEDGFGHSRREFLRRQAVAPPDDTRHGRSGQLTACRALR